MTDWICLSFDLGLLVGQRVSSDEGARDELKILSCDGLLDDERDVFAENRRDVFVVGNVVVPIVGAYDGMIKGGCGGNFFDGGCVSGSLLKDVVGSSTDDCDVWLVAGSNFFADCCFTITSFSVFGSIATNVATTEAAIAIAASTNANFFFVFDFLEIFSRFAS